MTDIDNTTEPDDDAAEMSTVVLAHHVYEAAGAANDPILRAAAIRLNELQAKVDCAAIDVHQMIGWATSTHERITK